MSRQTVVLIYGQVETPLTMTASGLHGSEALDVYRRNWLSRMLFGRAAREVDRQSDGLAQTLHRRATYEPGAIAGCAPLDPLAVLQVPRLLKTGHFLHPVGSQTQLVSTALAA